MFQSGTPTPQGTLAVGLWPEVTRESGKPLPSHCSGPPGPGVPRLPAPLAGDSQMGWSEGGGSLGTDTALGVGVTPKVPASLTKRPWSSGGYGRARGSGAGAGPKPHLRDIRRLRVGPALHTAAGRGLRGPGPAQPRSQRCPGRPHKRRTGLGASSANGVSAPQPRGQEPPAHLSCPGRSCARLPGTPTAPAGTAAPCSRAAERGFAS